MLNGFKVKVNHFSFEIIGMYNSIYFRQETKK